MTAPVAPSCFLITFCMIVGRAHGIRRWRDQAMAGRNTVLPGTRDHLAPLTRLHLRVDPGHFLRIGSNGGFDEQALEGMIEVPVIDDVLVVPDDLSGVGVDGQCAVVVEVREVVARERELGARGWSLRSLRRCD